MHFKRKAIMLMAVVMLLSLSIPVFAGNRTFAKYSYTTRAGDECWRGIVGMAKEDNDRTWYVTLPSSSGLGGTSNRAFFQSSTTGNALVTQSAPLCIYDGMGTKSQRYYDGIRASKGDWFNLYIHGNENNSRTYHVMVSGRYTP